jgi:hypothetical protein
MPEADERNVSMTRVLRRFGPAVVGLALVLAGCQAEAQGPAAAIEAYLAARAESNVDQMTLLSCPAWEGQARVEAASFEAMDARLDGVSCTAGSAEGDESLVSCTGQIVTTYQGETREWSVAEHPFRAVMEAGEWRMCGYGE